MADTANHNKSIKITRVMTASREKFFEAWTNPSLIKLWFAPDDMVVTDVVIHLKIGGSYKIVTQDTDGCRHTAHGVYQEIQKPTLVVYSWTWEGSDQKESKVSLQLSDTLKGTEINLTHDQFESIEARDRQAIVWQKCMDKLQTLL